MNFKAALSVFGYWFFGTAGSFIFRYGGVHPDKFWIFFILGNVMGFSSIWFLMKTYALIKNVNVATVLCLAGAFVIFQLLSWLIFRPEMPWVAILGLAMMVLGILLAVIQPEKKEESKC